MVSYLLFVQPYSSLVALLCCRPQPDVYCRHSNLYKLISIENLKTRLRATFKLLYANLNNQKSMGGKKVRNGGPTKARVTAHHRSPDPPLRPQWCLRKYFLFSSFDQPVESSLYTHIIYSLYLSVHDLMVISLLLYGQRYETEQINNKINHY